MQFQRRREEPSSGVEAAKELSSSMKLTLSRSLEQVSYETTKNELEELGYMDFEYDSLAEALEVGAETKKPIFSFQAVLPGDIATGRDIFSHPLIVEAAESLFVTHRSTTEKALPMARAPSGRICSTRVYLLDPDTGHELVPLISGDSLTKTGLISAMIQALEARSGKVPKYLQLLLQEETGYVDLHKIGDETTTRPRNYHAVFAMQDSALAEAEFGGLDGVLATRVGAIDRQKVVEVTYDSKELSYSELVRHALKKMFADVVYYQSNEERVAAVIEVTRVNSIKAQVRQFHQVTTTIKRQYDPKHALRATPMRFVPLTDLQATRANSLIHFGKFNQASHMLSPWQGVILMRAMRVCELKAFHEVVDVPILIAWMSICNNEHPKLIQGCSDYCKTRMAKTRDRLSF
jgi:hypothetical protein